MKSGKKILLFINLTIFSTISLTLQCTNGDTGDLEGQRTVLFEKFTGTWCGWCPYGVDILDEILETTDRIVVLAYHTKDSMSIGTTKDLTEAFDPRHPMAVIDRVQYPETEKMPISRNDWKRTVTYRQGARSFLDLGVSGIYDPGSRKIELDVKLKSLKDYTEGVFKLNVIVAQNGLIYTQRIFRDPERKEIPGYIHNYVVREMVTGAWGKVLEKEKIMVEDEEAQVLKGEKISFKLNEDFDAENCHIVIFIHEDLGKGYGPVQQATEISVKKLTGFDTVRK